MEIPVFKVDAFSRHIFSGNPAAVCPLDAWLPDQVLQAIAAENNLAETAFFTRHDGRFHLRWFTPACEVELCGHATLATAYVLLHQLGEQSACLRFDTKSGELTVSRQGDRLALNFPSRPPQPAEADARLVTALGGPEPMEILVARDYLIRYETAAEVKALAPNMEMLKEIDCFGFIVTAPGSDCDFVSRLFAPAQGIPEDPATGSSHCTLIPYWAKQLNKTEFFARQVSPRGGEMFCKLLGDRVEIAGHAALFLKGTIRF